LLAELNRFVGNSLPIRSFLGKFRFFAFERMIQTTANQTITLGVETNHFISIDCKFKANNFTQPIFKTNLGNATA